MRKCKGCGIPLQTKDKLALGYVVNLEQDYCQRCFRLSHYGDTTNLKSNYVTNENILKMYSRYKTSVFVLIVDVMDVFCLKEDDLLPIFRDYQTVLVINKTDILPENISEHRLEKTLSRLLFELNRKYPNIKAAIMTNRFEHSFNDQFFAILDELGCKSAVFAGRANAGKSTLINKLIHSDSLTTSIYPGTTLEEVVIDYRDYTFIDTPGLVDVNNYATYLNTEKYKLSKIDSQIRPQVFQVKDPQSYFYDGLLRVDIIPKENCSITFHISNRNRIHRTRFENADDYYQKHYCEFILRVKPLALSEFSVEKEEGFVLKGLGMFRIKGRCHVAVYSLANVKLFQSEVKV